MGAGVDEARQVKLRDEAPAALPRGDLDLDALIVRHPSVRHKHQDPPFTSSFIESPDVRTRRLLPFSSSKRLFHQR
jgi:hypothetical protein